MAANSRVTVGVEGEDPLLADAAMATEVSSDLPILSERAMYSNASSQPGVFWAAGSDAAGAIIP